MRAPHLLRLALYLCAAANADQKPWIVMIVADDIGYSNVNVNRPAPSDELETPHLDALALLLAQHAEVGKGVGAAGERRDGDGRHDRVAELRLT